MVMLSAQSTDRLYLPGNFLLLISVRNLADPKAIVRPERLCPVTTSGIEPATFLLVVQ